MALVWPSSPTRPRTASSSPESRCPNTAPEPRVGRSSVAMMRSKVVLPLPFFPRMAIVSPRPTMRSAPLSTHRLPKRRAMPVSSTAGDVDDTSEGTAKIYVARGGGGSFLGREAGTSDDARGAIDRRTQIRQLQRLFYRRGRRGGRGGQLPKAVNKTPAVEVPLRPLRPLR